MLADIRKQHVFDPYKRRCLCGVKCDTKRMHQSHVWDAGKRALARGR